MTAYFPFSQPAKSLFQFQPVLDGQTFSIVVSWSLFGQRYMLNCYSLSGALIFSLPMIGSPAGINVQNCNWFDGIATVALAAPLPYRVGTTFDITITGMSPDTWNGRVTALLINKTTFTFPLANDPGIAGVLGSASEEISLTRGYFNSTIVFRESTGIFEVNP